jgi:hypothetical protein
MSSDGPPRRRGGRGGGEGEGNAGLFPDLLRRGLTLMTEEALRRALGDSAPREMVEFLRDQSERMRNEFLDRMSREFGKVLSAMDPVEIAKRLLEGRTVEVSARIRFVDKNEKQEDD